VLMAFDRHMLREREDQQEKKNLSPCIIFLFRCEKKKTKRTTPREMLHRQVLEKKCLPVTRGSLHRSPNHNSAQH